MRVKLFVTQCLHRIKSGGASGWIKPGDQAHDESEDDREGHQPPRYRPEMFRRKSLILEIHVGPKVDDLSDGPAQDDSDNATENAHSTSLGKEKLLHVSVTGADGLHDSNFAAPLKNCHDQG